MNPTPADIIAAARMQVSQRHPYLNHALFALRPCPAPGLGTLAVDTGWRLYYDPATVTEWYEEMLQGKLDKVASAGKEQGHDGVAAVIFHEMGHCLRQHFKRTGGRDPEKANWSQDREINDDVEEAGWRLPGQPLLPEQIMMDRGLTFEEYYPKEKDHYASLSVVQYSTTTPGCGGACGGIAGNPTAWEREHGSSGSGAVPGNAAPGTAPGTGSAPVPLPLSEMEQEIVLRQTALKIAEAARSRGTVPGGLKAWATARLEPAKIDWRRRLPSFVRAAVASIAGACDITWRRIGRRSLHTAGRIGWPLAPALHQPVPKVVVLLDVSGSMGCQGTDEQRTLQDEALSEILGVVRACGGDVKTYACDAAVHAVAKVRTAADLEKLNVGGGGTSMREGFKEARKEHADIVLIVTDGLTDWPAPEECRRCRVLAVLVGEEAPRPPKHIPYLEAT